MNGVPGVMALESHASLCFSSSLMTLPIAGKKGTCKACVWKSGTRHTFPFSDCEPASLGLVFCLLSRPKASRALLVHLCTRSHTVWKVEERERGT